MESAVSVPMAVGVTVLSGEAKKRGGGRKPTSCLQCRQRKVKCSLGQPCSTCILRGDATRCTLLGGLSPSHFTNALPLLSPSSHLRSLLDRLESSLKLSSVHSRFQPDGGSLPDDDFGGVNSFAGIRGNLDFGAFEKNLILGKEEEEEERKDALRDLGRPGCWTGRGIGGNKNDVLEILPTKTQLEPAVASASASIPQSLAIYDQPLLRRLLTQLHSNPPDTTPLEFIAFILAVCGLGLSLIPAMDLSAHGLPEGKASHLLAKSWIDGAVRALALSDALALGKRKEKEGSEMSIRVVLLLVLFWIAARDGEWLEQARQLWEMAVTKTLDLGLHRDQGRSVRDPQLVTQNHELFWSLFYLDSVVLAFTSKSFATLDLSRIAIPFPPETSPLHLRHSISVVLHKISTQLSCSRNPSAVPYRILLSLNEDLKSIASGLPGHHLRMRANSFKPYREATKDESETLEFWSMISFGFTRLNRIFLQKGVLQGAEEVDEETHLTIIVYYSRLSMALKGNIGIQTWPFLLSRIEGAITLARVLQQRQNDASSQHWKRDLLDFLAELKSSPEPSGVILKGIQALQDLISLPPPAIGRMSDDPEHFEPNVMASQEEWARLNSLVALEPQLMDAAFQGRNPMYEQAGYVSRAFM
ncbi:hypothetical protein BT69DRAFT_1135536 [Atractiella rhizophila]|nr:hypothetical protein BT69DRAFT_1135536 [Atractiella rhizophila]